MSLNRPSAMQYFDRSGVIASPTEEAPVQTLLEWSPMRIGFDFQNQGLHDMYICIQPMRADEPGPTRYRVPAGESWYKDQFAPLNVVTVEGTPGEPFAASEYGI